MKVDSLSDVCLNTPHQHTLPGLFNQKYLQESLQREIHRSIRKEAALSLLIIELDHMTEINARYGQETRNEVLAAVGKFLEGQVRSGEIACRYRGDIFVLNFLTFPVRRCGCASKSFRMISSCCAPSTRIKRAGR